MKKLLFIVVLFLNNLGSFAQQTIEENIIGNNELRINAFWMLIGSVNISYDRVLNDNTSFGVLLEKTYDSSNTDREYTIAPYYRKYFSKKRAAGFYFETNCTVYKQRFNEYWPTYEQGSEVGVGVGIALGGKFVTKNGFVLDIYAGIGRNLNNPVHISELFSASGISIGKRF